MLVPVFKFVMFNSREAVGRCILQEGTPTNYLVLVVRTL